MIGVFKEIWMLLFHVPFRLEFAGMDSWDRPVYKDDVGTLWKDVNPRAGMKPDRII